jgi:hypothetical protein
MEFWNSASRVGLAVLFSVPKQLVLQLAGQYALSVR